MIKKIQKRYFFSFFEEPKPVIHKESRIVPYTCEQYFDIVADVGSYQKFLPWCQSSKILSKNESDNTFLAELIVGFKIFKERYTSKVILKQNEHVYVHAVNSSVFEKLDNRWEFEPTDAGKSTKLNFVVDFKFSSVVNQHISTLFLSEVVRAMVGAFNKRASVLYGPHSEKRKLLKEAGTAVVAAPQILKHLPPLVSFKPGARSDANLVKESFNMSDWAYMLSRVNSLENEGIFTEFESKKVRNLVRRCDTQVGISFLCFDPSFPKMSSKDASELLLINDLREIINT
eukprot:GHVL01038085.1.p1 GENE.GHVL01038085.1~~GHVL01038085.1.p1  ORF type:complete len:297 (-),score=34.10 GHVL01038085.1:11-871(-)